MPPIIGPIMIPMFVDLDIGYPNIGFPGAYLQGFTFTHICQILHTPKTMDTNSLVSK
jgi:hypothetical protein